MLQLPMTPMGTFKLILEIHEDKGYNRVEMRPRPQLDLQGKPNLLVYQAVDSNGQVLAMLAHEGKEWVEFNAKRHQPKNFLKPKPEPKPEPEPEPEITLEPMASVEPAPKLEPTLEPILKPTRMRPRRNIRKRRPIPKAGPDSVRVEPKSNENGGKVVTAKVSNHVEPKQGISAPPTVKTLPLPPKDEK